MKFPSLPSIPKSIQNIASNIGGEVDKVSKKTHDTISGLTDKFVPKTISKAFAKVQSSASKVSSGDLSSSEKVLGAIYKLIQINEKELIKDRQLGISKLEDEKNKEELWHKQLIDALTYRKTGGEEGAPPEKPTATKQATKPSGKGSRGGKGKGSGGGKGKGGAGAGKGSRGGKGGAGAGKGKGGKPGAGKGGAGKPGAGEGKATKVGKGAPEGPPVSLGPGDGPIMKMIAKHEGSRLKPYKDSRGLWTVGVGHLIGNGSSLPPDMDREFSQEEVDAMFAQDYAAHKKAAMKIPGYDKLNNTGQAAVVDLTFNMGPAWYKKFPNASAALAEGDTETFAKEMEGSAWYTQVGGRAKEIVSMIRNGKKTGEEESAVATSAPSAPASAQVASASSTNKDLKDDLSARNKATNTTINNVSSNKSSTTQQASNEPVDDRSAYQRKLNG